MARAEDRFEVTPDRRRFSLSTHEMLVGCAAILVVFALGVGFNLSRPRADAGAWAVGGDFSMFYTVGHLLTDHHQDRLYDADLAEKTYREVVPGATSLHRTFGYPPFVAALFWPLARLPYSQAFLIFEIITPLMFIGALVVLNARFGPTARDERALVLLAGMSFFPFMGYTWLGGQISVIGFGAVALALSEEDRCRPFLSGLALSLCLYKPTLLVLIVPMLLVSGRCWQCVGFLAGGCALAAVSVLVAGVDGTMAFVDKLRGVAVQSTTPAGTYDPYRYVDLMAFFRLLSQGMSRVGYAVLGAISVTIALALIRTWIRFRMAERPERLLVWAATITWTLVLNIYTPFYDTILVVAAAILAVAAVRARAWSGWQRLAPALLCVYVTPWIAEIAARTLRFQIDTVVLGGFGILLLLEAQRGSPDDTGGIHWARRTLG
jgi:hypothetical protein